MPKFYDSISDDLAAWALAQPVFFVASAPLTGSHVNLSPKGLPSSTLTILSPNKVAYIDATGSGCETISHMYENGRLTMCFCSFGKMPRIMRFFGRGRVVERGGADGGKEFVELLGKMGLEDLGGARGVVVVDVFTCQTSCGYGVPLLRSSPLPSPDSEHSPADPSHDVEKLAFTDRDTLFTWAGKMISKGELAGYQAYNNARSLDGLPGLKSARRERGEWLVLGDGAAVIRRIFVGQRMAVVVGVLLGIFGVWVVGLVQRLSEDYSRGSLLRNGR